MLVQVLTNQRPFMGERKPIGGQREKPQSYVCMSVVCRMSLLSPMSRPAGRGQCSPLSAPALRWGRTWWSSLRPWPRPELCPRRICIIMRQIRIFYSSWELGRVNRRLIRGRRSTRENLSSKTFIISCDRMSMSSLVRTLCPRIFGSDRSPRREDVRLS